MTTIIPIDQGRLWKRHMAMAQIGALPGGGVNRPALSQGDAQARSLLARWAEELGFSVETDPIGNLFVHRPGADDSLPPVLAGSHLDTQPTGGKFDGAFGVLAAFEALQAIHEAGIVTRRPIEVVSWTNEEGSRFQPGCSGSSAFTGAVPLEKHLDAVDRDGISARDALAAVLSTERGMPVRPLGFPIAAFMECHIEQGPRLEEAGLSVGIVTGIQGSRWFAIEVRGDEAHAGTTPRRNRRDALSAAIAMVAALERLMFDEEDKVRFTVGRFEVLPGSPNTIPGRVFFTIDFRHPEASTLKRLGDQVEAVCRAHAGPCAVTITETFHSLPADFDARVIGAMRTAADRLGIPTLDLASGALHDAKFLQDVCPSGMIFVPCEKGISHNEAENAKPEDLAAGTRVLAEALVILANA